MSQINVKYQFPSEPIIFQNLISATSRVSHEERVGPDTLHQIAQVFANTLKTEQQIVSGVAAVVSRDRFKAFHNIPTFGIQQLIVTSLKNLAHKIHVPSPQPFCVVPVILAPRKEETNVKVQRQEPEPKQEPKPEQKLAPKPVVIKVEKPVVVVKTEEECIESENEEQKTCLNTVISKVYAQATELCRGRCKNF